MRPAIRTWDSPRDLLLYLDASDIRLLVVIDPQTYRRTVRLVADRWDVMDDTTAWHIARWAHDLVALLGERRMKPPRPEGCPACPDMVIFAPSPSGRPALGYFLPDGASALFERRNGRWAPIEPG